MSIKLGSTLQALSAWGPFVPGPRVILRIKDDSAMLSREALGGDCGRCLFPESEVSAANDVIEWHFVSISPSFIEVQLTHNIV